MSDAGPLWRRLAAVFDHPSLSPNERLLLVVLEWYAKDGVAWPSVPTLGRKTGLTERAVYLVLAQLEQAGVLAVEHGGGRRRPNHYEVTLNHVQGFSDGAAPETLNEAPETLNHVQRNPEPRSGERSRELPREEPPTLRASPFASLPDEGPHDDHHDVEAAAPDGATANGPPPEFTGKVIALADRLAADRRAPGAAAPLTPEQFEERRRALLAQSEAYRARKGAG